MNATSCTPLRAIAIALAICVNFALASAATANDTVQLKRDYVDSIYGQVHLYYAAPSNAATHKVPVVFFHQTAMSGIEFKPILLEVAKDRPIIAFDTPGYGYSDRPSAAPRMSDLANAMAVALDNLGYGAEGMGPVDVLGYHTGVFIASELAIARPDLVRRVVMSGIGYFSKEGRERRYAQLPRDKVWAEDGTDVMRLWHRYVIKRPDYMSLDRSVEIFLETVRSAEKYWYAYDGVWQYPIEERFALLKAHPILVLQGNGYLLEHSRRAKAELIPDADYVEMLDLEEPVLEADPKQFAEELKKWLDRPL